MIFFGIQKHMKIGPPIFSAPLKVAEIGMYTKTDAKPVETFWENDQNFDLFGDPKWPPKWASEAHILHTSKSSYNKHVKQYWYKTSGKFLRKWPKTDAHIVYISESSSN